MCILWKHSYNLKISLRHPEICLEKLSVLIRIATKNNFFRQILCNILWKNKHYFGRGVTKKDACKKEILTFVTKL